MYRHIEKIVQLGSNNDRCYIQNRVVTKRVIKMSSGNIINIKTNH